ncbi:MAG: hypothetical protein QOH01_671 [Verrucomicrobiota bacterium]|jgi:hypothetical protein
MFLTIYAIVHTLISLIGILSGLIMLGGWLAGHRLEQLDQALPYRYHPDQCNRIRLPLP